MVDMVLLQQISYIAGALGVCVAAGYYVMTLRVQQANMKETMLNRRATLTNSLIQPFATKEWAKMNLELTSMKWDSFEDFKKKYDSRVNPENYATRQAVYTLCDYIGYQYKTGLIDFDAVYNVAGFWIADYWKEFGEVIREYRKSDYPSDYLENWEFIGEKLWRMKLEKDPEWGKKMSVVIETHSTLVN